MKYYEYLAAGLRVLGSRTETLAARNEPGVALYRDLDEAVAALDHFFAATDANVAGAEAARRFDWEARTETLLSFIDSVRR
jgi:hypothetical protein